jgi:hypothetical protein
MRPRASLQFVEATFVPLGGPYPPLARPGCSSAALRRALALGGWPWRVFAPLVSSPRLRGGQVGGRARLWPPIRTVILSYAKHGRCQANAQGRTRLLSFPAARKQVGGSKLVASALRLGIPQRPASVSGPRVVRKCNGAVASRVRAGAKSHGVAKRKPVNAADHQGPAWAAPISPISQSDCRTRPSPFSRPRFPAKAWSNDP